MIVLVQCSAQFFSIEVVAKLQQKEMISSGEILIANRISCVTGNLRAKLEHHSRREIASAMFAGKPIRREGYFFIYWLFETELTPSTIRRGHYIPSEVVASKGDSRSTFKGVAHFGINVVAGVVSTI